MTCTPCKEENPSVQSGFSLPMTILNTLPSSRQDRIPIFIWRFISTSDRDQKSALMLDHQCQMLGAVGHYLPLHIPFGVLPCLHFWLQALLAPGSEVSAVRFTVFLCGLYFWEPGCSVCSTQWVWSLVGVCQCVVMAVNNCCGVASTRTPTEWEGHCSAKRFSNTSPEVCCFGLHSHPQRAGSISLRLGGKYLIPDKTEAFIFIFSNTFFFFSSLFFLNLRETSQILLTLFSFSVMRSSFDWKHLHCLRFFEKSMF